MDRLLQARPQALSRRGSGPARLPPLWRADRAEAADAKPLKGFGGTGVLELLEDHQGNTYRAVYTVRFADAVYVLHAFQKKSKSGVATPKHELDVVQIRLKEAARRHEE